MIEWYFDRELVYGLSDMYVADDRERRKAMSNKTSIMTHNHPNASKGRSNTTNTGKPKK